MTLAKMEKLEFISRLFAIIVTDDSHRLTQVIEALRPPKY
jgi:hypothetical protein